MDDETLTIIRHALAHAPQWIRHDLASKDTALKRRAEETLAAIIAGALVPGTDEAPSISA